MDYNYGNETAYQKALAAVQNPAAFSYDPMTDPSYIAMRKQALRDGERASATTLAQQSAASAGRPNSYAVTAAAMANNNYMAQLQDAVPQFEANQYNRYLAELKQQQAGLDALTADRNFSYQQYLNQLQQEVQAHQMANADKELQLKERELKLKEDAAKTAASGGSANTSINVNAGGTGQMAGAGAGATAAMGNPGATGSSQIPANVLSSLENTYKDKTVTDSGVWNNLVTMYGEDALAKAGFKMKEKTDYKVTNRNGDGWISVDGIGRLSWAELEKMVDSGQVKETMDESSGTITYAKAREHGGGSRSF